MYVFRLENDDLDLEIVILNYTKEAHPESMGKPVYLEDIEFDVYIIMKDGNEKERKIKWYYSPSDELRQKVINEAREEWNSLQYCW